MYSLLKYIVVSMVLLSLGGCFIPVGGGGYYGGGEDDDAYSAPINTPIVTKVDWPQIYQGYAGPHYWNVPDQRRYAYRDNNRNDYYQQRHYYRAPREEDHRRREGEDN